MFALRWNAISDEVKLLPLVVWLSPNSKAQPRLEEADAPQLTHGHIS